MADLSVTTILLCIPRNEATALARLAADLDLEECALHADPRRLYGDRTEAEVMLSGLLILQGALAGAGFMPN